MKIRPACAADTNAIHALIVHYSAKGVLLPRSVEDVLREINSFTVCEHTGAIVGCLSLVQYHAGLAEIRSVAVKATKAGSGIGSHLVRHALNLASARGVAGVLAVTGTPEFFARFGFQPADGAAMASKVQRDCRECAKAQFCSLVPMMADLEAQPVLLPFAPHVNLEFATECSR